jgi:hypothetical protein
MHSQNSLPSNAAEKCDAREAADSACFEATITPAAWWSLTFAGWNHMTEDEALARFGLAPKSQDIPVVRALLASQITAAKNEEDDPGLMKLCCIQLFSNGDVSDSMLIWAAKQSSFDNGTNIDVQLICGAGLDRTIAHLATLGSQDAAEAMQYITDCKTSGDFERFATEEVLSFYRDYYGL